MLLPKSSQLLSRPQRQPTHMSLCFRHLLCRWLNIWLMLQALWNVLKDNTDSKRDHLRHNFSPWWKGKKWLAKPNYHTQQIHCHSRFWEPWLLRISVVFCRPPLTHWPLTAVYTGYMAVVPLLTACPIGKNTAKFYHIKISLQNVRETIALWNTWTSM